MTNNEVWNGGRRGRGRAHVMKEKTHWQQFWFKNLQYHIVQHTRIKFDNNHKILPHKEQKSDFQSSISKTTVVVVAAPSVPDMNFESKINKHYDTTLRRLHHSHLMQMHCIVCFLDHSIIHHCITKFQQIFSAVIQPLTRCLCTPCGKDPTDNVHERN